MNGIVHRCPEYGSLPTYANYDHRQFSGSLESCPEAFTQTDTHKHTHICNAISPSQLVVRWDNLKERVYFDKLLYTMYVI